MTVLVGLLVFVGGAVVLAAHILLWWWLMGRFTWFMFHFHALGTILVFQVMIAELYLVANNREHWMEWLQATLA